MSSPTTRLPRPARDEWGVYDPEQAGLAALYARLDKNDQPDPPAAAPAKKETTALVPVRPSLRDAQ
jgi:hypothetical protein